MAFATLLCLRTSAFSNLSPLHLGPKLAASFEGGGVRPADKAFARPTRLQSRDSFALVAAICAGAAAASYRRRCRRCAVTMSAAGRGKKKKGVRIFRGREIPFNLYSPKEPLRVKVVPNQVQPQTLSMPTGESGWETCHITVHHGGRFPFLEGQSVGVIAPGPDKKGEVPAKVRLYTIASTAAGDDERGHSLSICVKRGVEVDGDYANREVGEDLPDASGTSFPGHRVYRGVASNHVCDARPGDELLLTGPAGVEMLLPEAPDANLIMLATGTGLAPFRSFLRLLFHDAAGADRGGSRKFKGMAWLFMGVPFSRSLLYEDELQEYVANFPDQFRYERAISREQQGSLGQKMYIQTRMAEHAEELWALMQDEKTHVYACGLKGMEAGLRECFGPVAARHGESWSGFAKAMKKSNRYHLEVY